MSAIGPVYPAQIVVSQAELKLERFPLDMGHFVYPACRK